MLLQNLKCFFFPQFCWNCEIEIADNGFCPTCWKILKFWECLNCANIGTNCILCTKNLGLENIFSFQAIFQYSDIIKGLILRLKHGDNQEALKFWGCNIAQKLDLYDEGIIIPIPLHWTRALKRGYNQMAVVGQHIPLTTKFSYCPEILKRIKYTKSQGAISGKERSFNLKNAFAVSRPELIKDKTCILIDDVITTGATLNNAAKVLLQNGAAKVAAITLASAN